MKATAVSPANIAFIKYWGRKDHDKFLPLSTTNSMNLANCTATTTVEFDDKFKEDQIIIIKEDGSESEVDRKNEGEKDKLLFQTLERIREFAGKDVKAKVVSKLNFPYQTGIASSAAGISAFVAAGYKAAGLNEKVDDPKELSREVRLAGSVSAARSVFDGFVECVAGDTHEESYSVQIADEKHWDLVDIVAVLNAEAKIHTSASGHKIADTSPFYEARIEYLEDKPQIVKDAIIEKDFKTLAHYSEMDTINMHSIMMTSTPPLFYLSPGSIDIIKKVRTWRADGLDVFYTFDAGANPHIIATERCADEVYKLLEENRYVNKLIKSAVGKGTRFVDTHLF